MSELRSPLGSVLIDQLAELIANGQGVNLTLISPEDRAAIYGAWVRLLERRAIQALVAMAENERKIIEYLAERERCRATRAESKRHLVERPDGIIAGLLTSAEILASLNLTVARVHIASASPLGAFDGVQATLPGQARCLRQYLRWRVSGELPDPSWPNCGALLRPALRAWANILDPTDALAWVENGLPPVEAVHRAGLAVLGLHTRAMDRFGVPVDGVYSGSTWGLPYDASPPPDEWAYRLRPIALTLTETGPVFRP